MIRCHRNVDTKGGWFHLFFGGFGVLAHLQSDDEEKVKDSQGFEIADDDKIQNFFGYYPALAPLETAFLVHCSSPVGH